MLGNARNQLARVSLPLRDEYDDAVPPDWLKQAKPLPPADWVVKVAKGAPHLLKQVDQRYVRSVLKSAHVEQIDTRGEPIGEQQRRDSDRPPPVHGLRMVKSAPRFRLREAHRKRTAPHIDSTPPLTQSSTTPAPTPNPLRTRNIITKPAANDAKGIRSISRAVISEEPPIRQITSQPPTPAPINRVRSSNPRHIPLIVRETTVPRVDSPPRAAESHPAAAEGSTVQQHTPTMNENPEMRTHTPTPPETRDRINMLITQSTPEPFSVEQTDNRWASLLDTEDEDTGVKDADQQHRERINREQRGDSWSE